MIEVYNIILSLFITHGKPMFEKWINLSIKNKTPNTMSVTAVALYVSLLLFAFAATAVIVLKFIDVYFFPLQMCFIKWFALHAFVADSDDRERLQL